MNFGFDDGGGGNTSSSSTSYGENYTYFDPNQLAAQNQLQQQFFSQMGNLGPNQGQTGLMNNRYGSQVGGAANSLAQQRYWNRSGLNQLNQFAQQENPYLQQQIAGLGQDIGQQFRQQILPGIGNQFQGAGQRGSSRHGVAQGMAAQGAMDTFGQQANALRYGAYTQQQQAAQNLAALGLQGSQTAGNQQLAGLGQLGDYQANTWQAQNMPFMIGAEVAGNPQTLSYGYDFSESESKGKTDGGGGFNFGL